MAAGPLGRGRLVRGRAGSGAGSFPFALTIFLLLLAGTVSWRQKVYYDGGLDPVVVAKAVITAVALLMSVHARASCAAPNPVGRRAVGFLTLYLAVSTFGGWAAGDGVTSAVVAVRVAMVAVAAYLLVRTFRVDVLLRALFTAMALVGMTAVLTGAVEVASTGGRLQGGIPPLAANEIALLCGVPALALIWRQLSHRGRGVEWLLVVGLAAAVWASESRTGLAALLVATLVMVVQARRMPPAAVAAVLGAGAGAVYVMLTTNLLSAYFERSNHGSVATLNSRTIAWEAAIDLPQTAVAWWAGGGLSLKRIPVQGQYWDDQGLDSSWFSAWVQGGLLCVLILAAWVICVLVSGARAPRPYRMLLTGVLVFQVLRSSLESGLVDGTPSFLLFITMSMLAEAASRPTLAAAAAEWPAVHPVRSGRAGREAQLPARPLLRR